MTELKWEELKWEDPTPRAPRAPRGFRAIHWVELATLLRQRPDEWLNIGRMHQQTAGNIRSGQLVAFRPKGDFEAVARKGEETDGHRMANIFVRYVGPQ